MSRKIFKDKDGDFWYENGDGTYRLQYADGTWSEGEHDEPLSEIEYFDGPLTLVSPTHSALEESIDRLEGRQTFEGGGMRDSQNGKPRFDLTMPEGVPYEEQMLTRFAVHMGKGAEKYEDRNWEKFGDEESLARAKASLLRHAFQLVSGEEDEDHASAIFFNAMCIEFIKGRLAGKW